MAYSEALAHRIRQALAPLPSVKEQKMFGGLSFMVNGKLCVGVYSAGDSMLLRCDPEKMDELITNKGAEHAMMKGKPMARGWLLVGPEKIASEEDFAFWIGVALEYNQKIEEEV